MITDRNPWRSPLACQCVNKSTASNLLHNQIKPSDLYIEFGLSRAVCHHMISDPESGSHASGGVRQIKISHVISKLQKLNFRKQIDHDGLGSSTISS